MIGAGPRVLVLADSRSFHTERYVAELRRQGCEVLVASLEEGAMPHHALRRRGFIRALHYPLAATEVSALIDSFRPDVVNPHFASGYGFLAALAVRRQRCPILLHLWGSDILIAPRKSVLHRRKTRVALESADLVVGDSDYLLSEAGKIGEIQQRRTIAWGIEREALRYRRETISLKRPLRILVPRPHEAVYNNVFIVKALAGPVNNGQVELTFPEFGHLVDRFKSSASGLTGSRVKFYPKMPRPDYLRFAAEHDVYLSAALSDSSPASLLEAMALGLIPVVGDVPGVREWVTPDSGYLFDLGSPRSLYEIIAHLADGDDDHRLMREYNLERITQTAVFEDNVAETIRIMRELTSGGTA